MKLYLLGRLVALPLSVIISQTLMQPSQSAELTMLAMRPMQPLRDDTPVSAVIPASKTLPGGVSAADMTKLSEHSVVLLIDKSRSMGKEDCGNSIESPFPKVTEQESKPVANISRWEWCRRQTLDLAGKTHGVIPAGITVVLFSDDVVTYPNVDATTIEAMFAGQVPKGGTNTALALKGQLDQYFASRSTSGATPKPLLIAVITDGCPKNFPLLCDSIVAATEKMKSADEIAITFLQVGTDLQGGKLLDSLDNDLVNRKARFDIVSVKSFAQMKNTGLVRALTDTIGEKSKLSLLGTP